MEHLPSCSIFFPDLCVGFFIGNLVYCSILHNDCNLLIILKYILLILVRKFTHGCLHGVYTTVNTMEIHYI